MRRPSTTGDALLERRRREAAGIGHPHERLDLLEAIHLRLRLCAGTGGKPRPAVIPYF